MIRARYRVRFAKTGLLRWTSHHDLMRLWERTLRRIALPLSMTEGFHPKPRISFPSALALGIAGEDEVVEFELSEELAAEEILGRLRDDQQPGLNILSVSRILPGVPKAQMAKAEYRLHVPADRHAETAQAIDRFRSLTKLDVLRNGKAWEFDVSREVADLRLDSEALFITLNASRQTALRPADVVAALGLEDLITHGEPMTRVRVELEIN